MRRLFLLSAALILWGMASTAVADYVIIRVILKARDDGQPNPGGPGPGGEGQQPPPGQPGGPGPGMPGRPGPGGRAPSGPGAPGGTGQRQPNNSLQDLGLMPEDYVTAVVEVKKRVAPERVPNVGTLPPHIETKYGKTYLYQDGVEILVDFAAIPQARGAAAALATPAMVFEKQHAKIAKNADGFWMLGDYALGRGLPDKCIQSLDELVAKIAEGGPAPVSARAQKGAEAYAKIKPFLSSTATSEANARKWSQSLNLPSVTTSEHYAIISQSNDPEKDGINRRLEQFEKLYKEFYLWFALRGTPLPELKEKLVCVLLNNAEKFRDQRQAFEVDELINDGFMLQQQNVAVVSMQRLDTPSRNFKSSVASPVYREMGKYGGIGREELLKGKFPQGVKTVAFKGEATVRESTRSQVIALVDMALQEEAELASTTHEGSRQLLAATGVLSATAPAPQWLRFGTASVFETPKGPFHHGSPVKVAFWNSVGSPHWAYMKAFSEMVASKEIYPDPANPNPAALLYLAISDEFFSIANEIARQEEKFRQANGGSNNTVDGGGDANDANVKLVLAHLKPGEAALMKARTIAWGLTYYLMKARYDEFQKFLHELAVLPRDVELDHRALVSAFARSFTLSDAGLQDDYPKAGAFLGMGKNWLDFMKREFPVTEELKLEPPVQGPLDPNGNPIPPGGPGGPQPGGPGTPGRPGN